MTLTLTVRRGDGRVAAEIKEEKYRTGKGETQMVKGLAHACNILIRECAHVRKGEEVLVLADDAQERDLVSGLAAAVSRAGARAISMLYPVIAPYREPPRSVVLAMKNAPVVLACGTTPMAAEVIKESLESGARMLSMFRISPESFARTVPIDYRRLKREMRKIKDILDGSGNVEIASPAGTEFKVQMAGRPTKLALGSVRKAGEVDHIAAGAIGVAPLEGTAEGRIVVDGTILGFGRAFDPVTLDIRAGKIVKIKGGGNWKGLRRLLRRDQHAPWVCEIGLGVNPKARLVGGPEDERVRGSVHVGFGENRFFEGTIASASHMDGTMLRATLRVDGKELVKGGRLLI
jgi:leucyl aminopeptidase (aminopeptidase T)